MVSDQVNFNMVSVIINTINENSESLKKAVESYACQDTEIIISTIKGDSSIKLGYKTVISEKGIYKQLNNAIKEITGEYFCYASGNDIAMPDKIKTEVKILEQTDKKVCYSAFYRIENNVRKTNFFHDYDFKKHLAGNFVSDCSMIETNLLRKYLPFNERWENDAFYDLWLRIYKGEGNVFVYNSNPTWIYIIDKNSLHKTRQRDKMAWNRRNKIRAQLINHYV